MKGAEEVKASSTRSKSNISMMMRGTHRWFRTGNFTKDLINFRKQMQQQRVRTRRFQRSEREMF
jgi:hypothetical protein